MKAFESDDMARGYATCRPPVHRRVIELALGSATQCQRALDIGCGAGLSTRALAGVARELFGLEPVAAMLTWSADIAPGALFVQGAAERIPFANGSVDLITAAGSLNYVDLDLSLREAARVLRRAGLLLIYDFSPGRTFRDDPELDTWFTSFVQRYPPPAAEGKALNQEIFADLLARSSYGFRMQSSEAFEVGLQLTPEFYLNYILTETNVAAAVRSGISRQAIQSWCTETLAPIWNGVAREVLFRGYFVLLKLDT